MRDSWKRIAAGALSIVTVAGFTPANVGGFLTGSTGIVANAATDKTETIDTTSGANQALTVYDGQHFEVIGYKSDQSGLVVGNYNSDNKSINVHAENGEEISKIEYTIGYNSIFSVEEEDYVLESSAGTVTNGAISLRTGDTIIVDNIPEGTPKVILSAKTTKGYDYYQIKSIKVYYKGSAIDPTYEILSADTTYDGTEKELISVSGDGGPIHYRYKEEKDAEWSGWSTEIPKAANAGNYFIQGYSEATDEYKAKGSEGDPVEVIAYIKQADLTLTAADGLVYNGEEQTLVKGDVPDGKLFTSTDPAGLDENAIKKEYDVIYGEKRNSGYFYLVANEREATYSSELEEFYVRILYALDAYESCLYKLSIGEEAAANNELDYAKIGAKRAIDMAYNINYSADVNKVVDYIRNNINNTSLDAVKARFAKEVQWSTTPTAAINAGEYTVWYKGGGVNYTDTVKRVDAQIAKADPTYKPPKSTVPEGEEFIPYDGKEHDLIEPGTAEGGTMLYRYYDGSDEWTEDTPKSANVGIHIVDYMVKGDENHNDISPDSQTHVQTLIDYAVVNVTVPEEAVIDGQDIDNGVYKLSCNNTYNIFSDVSLEVSDKDGLKISTSTDEAYKGKTYNYKYTVKLADIMPNGKEIEFAHKHAAKAFSTDDTHKDTDKVWVYCEGEPSKEADCVAYLDTDGTYYYGEAPKADDVKLKDYFGASVKVADFYFTKNGNKVSEDEMEIGETYIVNAIIAVTIDGKVSNFAISREIKFEARPLRECDIYYIDNAGDEVLITENFWNDRYENYQLGDLKEYDGKERKFEVIVRNPANGEKVKFDTEYKRFTADSEWDTETAEHFADSATDADWYWTGFNAPEYVGDKLNNYTGNVSISWGIGKADADVSAVAAKDIIYDGKALDETDFVFTDNQGVLKSKDAKITVSGGVDTFLPGSPDGVTITEENMLLKLNNIGGGDLTNAGEHNAKITITSKNYNDIVLDVPAAINKRPVTLTAEAGQKSTFGDTEAPTIKYTVEEQNDEKKRGFIATDLGVNQKPADFFGNAVIVGKEKETTNILNPGKNDAFDYNEFDNDAGTYQFDVSDAEFANYVIEAAETPLFTIEQKDIASDDIVITLTADEFNYDGTTHITDVESVMFGDTALFGGVDYNLGGTLQKVYPGKYNVQLAGQGNYTGIAYKGWTINALDGAAELDLENDGFKIYDGKDVSDMFTIVYGKIPASKAKVSVTYEDENGNKLNAAPVNAGKYKVKAEITAKGYNTENLEADLVVEKANVDVICRLDKGSIVYSETAPQVTGYTFVGVLPAEKADFEAKTTVDWTIDEASHKFNGFVNTTDEYNNNYSFTIVSPEYIVEPKDIESEDVTVSYVAKQQLAESGWTVCDSIVVTDNKTGKTLAEGIDYTINGNTSKSIGEFTIEILGISNYNGIRELPWSVVEEAIAEVSVNITENEPAPINNGKTRVTVGFGAEAEEGTEIVEYGIIYSNDGSVADASALTLETVNNDSVKKANYYSANILDKGNGVVAVGYVIAKDTYGLTKTIYTNDIGGSYAQLVLEKSMNLTANEPAPINNGKTRVTVGFTAEAADGVNIKEYGLLYSNNGSVTDVSALTLDAVDGTNVKQGKGFYSANVLDNGSGVTAVGYVIAEDAEGNTVTLYTDDLGGKYDILVLKNSVTLTENAPSALNNGKTRVTVGFTADAADGVNIKEYGLLYSNNGSVTDASALTLDAVDSNNVKQGKELDSANILDKGSGVLAVGYVIAEDTKGNTITLYTNDLGGSYDSLHSTIS